MSANLITVECEFDAETKNMVRYAEIGTTFIRTIYLSKEIVAQPYPTRIEVAIRVSNKKT